MEWPNVRLAEVTKGFISGGTPSTRVDRYWSGDIPWITGADVNGRVVLKGRKAITPEAVVKSATHVVPRGAILLVTRTGVGRVAKAGADIAISQDLTGVVPKEGTNADYIVAALQQKLNSLMNIRQGAIIKGILRKDIENLTIPYPPLSEQGRIVEILEQADRICCLRTEADAKAARILPAIFYEMFGKPDRVFEVAQLGDLLKRRKGALQSGPFGTHLHNSDFVSSGTVLAVGIDNVLDGEFALGRNRRITLEKYEQLSKYTLEPGDVLITVMGTVGRSCVFPGTPSPAICTKHVYRIQPDRAIHPEYLSATLRFSQEVRAQIGTGATGQIVAGIGSDALRRLHLPVPPRRLQDEYAERKKKVERSLFRAAISARRLEKLVALLHSRAFSGSLTAAWRGDHMREVLLQEIEK